MTPLEEVRFEIGDEAAPPAQLFTDPQIQHKVDVRGGNVILASADLCDVMATRTAGEFDFNSAARQQFKRSQKSEAWERRAAALRSRAGGLSTVSMTRVDGYTEDVSTRDGAAEGSRTGRVRQGYTDPDIPA